MKKKLLILFVIIAVIIYIAVIFLFEPKDTLLPLFIASFLLGFTTTIYKNNKKKNIKEFKVDKVEITKKETSDE